MEIRTLEPGEEAALLALVEGAGPADDWLGGEFYARMVTGDPSFAPQNVLVASERGQLRACTMIVQRRLRILGHEIPCGGLGCVMVEPELRGRGVASNLVEQSAIAMRERGLEISLAFSKRAELFLRLGWNRWLGQRSILRRGDSLPPNAGQGDAGSIEIVALDTKRDRALSAVRAIHSAYSGSRNGTVIRDDRLWEASLGLAGNPQEEFWVARRGGLAVAYARVALLPDGLTVTEIGRFEDGAAALAQLISEVLTPRKDDPLAPEGHSSEQVRSFALLPTFDDIGLTVGLEHHGISSHPIDDESGLIRCLNISALAARLDVALLPGEGESAFLRRILPPDGFVFWPADRF